MDFLAAYDFEFQYYKGSENKSADFLSRLRNFDAGGEGDDEGELAFAMVVQGEDSMELLGVERELRDTARYLQGQPMTGKTGRE